MGNQQLQITNLNNAALLIRWNGMGILIDALYDKVPPGLSVLPPALLEGLVLGQGIFSGVDYVLISHCHPDHYSPAVTARYLRRHPLRGIFLPVGTELPEPGASAPALNPGHSNSCSFTVPGGTVTAFRTRHLGVQYRDVVHYSFLLELGDRSLFIAADAGAQDNDFLRLLSPVKPEILFVTPLFPAHSAGRDALRALNPQRVGIYHLPREADDTNGYRPLLRRTLDRYGAQWPNTTVFWDPPQTWL